MNNGLSWLPGTKRGPPGGFSAARGRRALLDFDEGHVSETWERLLRDYVKRKYAVNSRKRGPPVGFSIARGKRNGDINDNKRGTDESSAHDTLQRWNTGLTGSVQNTKHIKAMRGFSLDFGPKDAISYDGYVPSWSGDDDNPGQTSRCLLLRDSLLYVI